MKSLPVWEPQRLLQSPLFEPLYPELAGLASGPFPSLDDLNALLVQREIAAGSGKPLRFVAQAPGRLPLEAQYEPRCYLAGEVQTRPDNWHDLFNALVWLAFPQAKAAINRRHYAALTEAVPAGGRGGGRDMLTLFDESGVVVACADDELAGLLRDFRWKEPFWLRRERLPASMAFSLFGHGLYEKALQPYVGMTGQALVLQVAPEFFAQPLAQRLAQLDGLLADYLAAPQHCRHTRELTPLPLLGIPGWTAENSDPGYYDNTRYFRNGRGRFKLH
jgi:hypothetical protein